MIPGRIPPLRRIRRELDLTLEQFAEIVGIHHSSVSRIERGAGVTREVAEQIVKRTKRAGLPAGFEDFNEMHVLYPKRYMEKTSARRRA